MIFHERELIHKELLTQKNKNRSIGLVPTMGALHQGHLTLVARALRENDVVVVSIFVNPTQFDNTRDLDKYPRTLVEDTKLLNKFEGTILIFAPEPRELYGGKVRAKRYRFGGLEYQMEGKYRKGHFNGVGTVLNLLFRAIEPHKAYFGEKDFQQLQIVKKLVAIEKLPVKIIGCKIVREPHGLAMSSRNKRLTPAQFKEASFIYETLLEARRRFPTHSIAHVQFWVEERFRNNKTLRLEYFEIANVKNLRTAIRKRKGNTYRAFIAVFAGEVRLIDNIALN